MRICDVIHDVIGRGFYADNTLTWEVSKIRMDGGTAVIATVVTDAVGAVIVGVKLGVVCCFITGGIYV